MMTFIPAVTLSPVTCVRWPSLSPTRTRIALSLPAASSV
jgi:hypothetical protein